MKTELENEEIHRYLRVYHYYKDLILQKKLPEKAKLPSIRSGAVQFGMSRTTMETAYMLLAAEGYIVSRPQSGYFVTDIASKRKKSQGLSERKIKKSPKILYDFVTTSVDKESFRFDVWRRYMKSALRQDERLLSYGEPQGEYDFREVLSTYLRQKRNVICTPEQIVVGAGVQSLLHVLCPLIKNQEKAAFYNPGFIQGKTVFEDYGFEITNDYKEEKTGVYYLTPSQMTKWGEVMAVSERLDLIRYATSRNLLLIEDDYNNEFRYFQRPTPSLQGLSGGNGVVYLGTFSKLLLPSIRMSFMVLPAELLEKYERKKAAYNQTASKAEQIAISQYIRDGHLDRQIRKSRKIYIAKAKSLGETAERVLGDHVKVTLGEAGFMVLLGLKTEKSADEITALLKEKGILVLPIDEKDEKHKGEAQIMLSCANVAVEEYETVMQILREIIRG